MDGHHSSSRFHGTKYVPLEYTKILGLLVFGGNMILLINRIANWIYILERNQIEIEKHAICKNSTIIYHDYNIGHKVTVRRNQAYKYETPFQGPYKIVQMWTNRTVTIRKGAVISRLNIGHIKTYNSLEIE